VVQRNSKRGSFYGCNKYPKCDFVLWNKPVEDKCPACGCAVVNEKENKTNGLFRQCPLCDEAWDLQRNKIVPVVRQVKKKAK
jgi:DNA topoisomerase-1